MPHCPQGVRCAVSTTRVCTHAKQDGLTAGSVIRTLGFKAEATTPQPVELPLQVELVAGPVDPRTGVCTDPIDTSDPDAPKFVEGVLTSEPIELFVTVRGSDAPSPSEAGTGTGTDAGTSNEVCCCDFRTPENMWHCTHSLRSGALCNVPWPECCNADYTICE